MQRCSKAIIARGSVLFESLAHLGDGVLTSALYKQQGSPSPRNGARRGHQYPGWLATSRSHHLQVLRHSFLAPSRIRKDNTMLKFGIPASPIRQPEYTGFTGNRVGCTVPTV